MNLIKYFFNGLFVALARKEINQLLRDKSLIILLFIPPILRSE
ncbi:MAG: hypothetical protein RLZZ381_827, partial [Cyanobacteriota bacterium]